MKIIATLVGYILGFAVYLGCAAIALWVATKIVKAAWMS